MDNIDENIHQHNILLDSCKEYVESRGEPVNALLEGVCEFFIRSNDYATANYYRDAAAAALGFDLSKPEEQKKLWTVVEEYSGPQLRSVSAQKQFVLGKRRTAGRRSKEEYIPSLDELFRVALLLTKGVAVSEFPTVHVTRSAIALTLTYIRVYRWPNGIATDPQAADLVKAHARMKTHPRAREVRQRRIKDDRPSSGMIAEVVERFPLLAIHPEEIGDLRRHMEKTTDWSHPWFWPFTLFHVATGLPMPDGRQNRHQDIWRGGPPLYNEFWR